MRVILTCLGAALAGCTAPPPVASSAPIAELAGRIAGPPQRCVLITQSEGFSAANRNTLLLRKGKAIWVNRLQGTCGGFDRWDVIVTEPLGSQHCEGDVVRSFDPVSKFPGPTCRMGAFIPYTRG